MTTVIVSGAIANKLLNGGEAWTRLSYIFGLRKLGFDVYFVEQIDPATCVDDVGKPASFEASANVAWFRHIVDQFGLMGRAALVEASTRRTDGISYDELLEIAESAALLVNISGNLHYEGLMRRIPRKAYIDLDPGFTQFWYAERNAATRLAGHEYYFTVGENIGRPSCSIPTGDIRWRPTRQPVVLEHWPVCTEGDPSRFTTIANWRGPFGPVTYGGKTFGLKVHQFRKYIDLPLHVDGTFEIALNIHPADHQDRESLLRHSWRLVDPKEVAGDPFAFQRYVQASGAEFSAAQQIYVDTRSGWFSDRTVRYLASGKPVLVEDTGLAEIYEIGQGLVTFSSLDEAAAGANYILQNYTAHARAARQLAETRFESSSVLRELIDEVGICA
jgi:hypothetical protein